MTQNEVLAMLHDIVADNQQYTTWTVSTPHLVMLVNNAVQAEREACVKIVESEAMQYAEPVWAFEIVNDIKARGNVATNDTSQERVDEKAKQRHEPLTDEELKPICDEYRILFGDWVHDFARAIEAKLKEPNT